MAGQAEAWFKLADQDGDGAVGGAEAVRFFTRSGLPQDVLGQVNTQTSENKDDLDAHTLYRAQICSGAPHSTVTVT